MSPRLTHPPRGLRGPHPGAILLALMMVLLSGCATVHSPTRPAARSLTEAGSAGGLPEQPDAFQRLLEACGLEEALRHPVGAALYTAQARLLWESLARTSVTQRSMGPRLLLSWLLREALTSGQRVEYADLRHRTEQFRTLVVVRPDGYLVTALTGEPLQRMGQVRLEDGELKVGRLVVGTFYFSHDGVFYPVDEALRRLDTPPWGELGLERDWLNAALDGAQDASVEVAGALAQSILHPIRSVEGLAQLPTLVARLIVSSPEYFAHYGTLSLQDQIREAARLSTHLLLLYGSAAGTVGRMGGLGAEVSLLSLSAKGSLAVSQVRVPVGAVMTSVSMGTGAVSILHMSAQNAGSTASAPPKPPGRWVHKTPTTDSEDALRYQEQVTGQPPSRVYLIEAVEFDGFTGRELLEAKGPGYLKFFNKDGTPKSWYVASEGFRGLLEQAKVQANMARQVKLPLVWHVAEAEVVKALREIFKNNQLSDIDVRHTTPAP